MSNPEFSGETGNERDEASFGLPAFSIPDTAYDLLEQIDFAKELELTRETVQMTLALQGRLRGIDGRFGANNPQRISFFSQPVEGGDRSILVATQHHETMGDVWHIIINNKLHDEQMVFFSSDEYAVAKELYAFDHRDGFMSGSFPGQWDAEHLGDSVRIRKAGDNFTLTRGVQSKLVMPRITSSQRDLDRLRSMYQEMVYLDDVLESLNEVIHDEEIVRGKLH